MRVGILGLGKMGEAIAAGLNGKGYEIQGTSRSDGTAQEAAQRLSITCHTDNRKLAKGSDILLLCVKPQQAQNVLKEIAPDLKKGQLLISICASITTGEITQWSGGKAGVIRAMPNTPCLIGQGMTVLCSGPKTTSAEMDLARGIFETLGKTAVIEEHLMDGATGLSGCGPAYVYLIVEALSEAGVKIGLPRQVSTLLAAQTLAGASQMVLARDCHPAELKDEVTTPAGCTIDGLMALEEGKLRVTLIKAVLAAAKRSRSLREK